MVRNTPPTKRRSIERAFLGLITIVLGLLFVNLHSFLQRDFVDVHQRLSDGTMINLNDLNPGQRIKNLLERGYYFEDKRDIELIQSVVANGLSSKEEPIDNTGELNKRKYNVVADDAFQNGGESFKKRVAASRLMLGYSGDDSSLFFTERISPVQLSATTNVSNIITGSINWSVC